MSDLNREILEKLGNFTRVLRKEVSLRVKSGVDITELIDFLECKIFEAGYLPSFPAMVSVNDMAAHYTVFEEGYILKKGDVIKVDFGVSYQGYITDNAFTVEIEDNKYDELISCSKACLDAAVERAELGATMNDIGYVVYEVAKQRGFNTIHNLSGHQIGRYNLHCGLGVPNYANGDMSLIKDSMQFAIEPFVTTGQPKIKACRPSNILHLVRDKPVRDPIAMKVLKHIREHFPKLPFSKRWLVQSVIEKNLQNKPNFTGFDKQRVLRAISVLKTNGVIYEYDELGTVDGSIVAQFEDCVLFENNEKTIITRL